MGTVLTIGSVNRCGPAIGPGAAFAGYVKPPGSPTLSGGIRTGALSPRGTQTMYPMAHNVAVGGGRSRGSSSTTGQYNCDAGKPDVSFIALTNSLLTPQQFPASPPRSCRGR